MEPNPLRELREIRRQISLECDDDAEKVFDYYVAHQEKMKSTGNYNFVSKPARDIPAALTTEQANRPEPQ